MTHHWSEKCKAKRGLYPVCITSMKLLPEFFKMKITPLAGTIKRVALHSGVSHHLFERRDSGKRESDTRHFNSISHQRAEIS